jgi:hypothetical protein
MITGNPAGNTGLFDAVLLIFLYRIRYRITKITHGIEIIAKESQ